MNLKAQLATIAAAVDPTVSFRYGRKHDENINGDNAAYPAIVLLEPDQFGFRVSPQNGSVYDRYNIFVQFVMNATGLGEQANARESAIEQMRTLAAKFIVALNNSNIFNDIPENIQGVTIIDTYDVNVCGIEINISNLTDTQPRPLC